MPTILAGRTDRAGRAADGVDRIVGWGHRREEHEDGPRCCGASDQQPERTSAPMTVEATAELTMYSTQWCGYCIRLKKQLEREGIPFEVVDIEIDPEAAAFVENVNGGNQTVPTVRFADGSAMTNPSFAQVTGKLQALAQAV
jgi:mycoredoxin